MGGASAAAVILPAIGAVIGLGVAKKAITPVIPPPTTPVVPGSPPPVEKEDISKGAATIAKRRIGAVGAADRRSVTSTSLLSDDFSNTLLGN